MKRSIDFYQKSLKPKQDPLPLSLVSKIIAATVVVVVLCIALQSWRLESTQQKLVDTQNKVTTMRNTTKVLNEQLQKHRDVAALEEQLRKQQQRVKNRVELIEYLNTGGTNQVANYSEFMTDLARYHNEHLWLTDISVASQHLQLQGQTLQPSVIATWLNGLKQSRYFSGKEFSVLEFEKREELREFRVSTQLEGVGRE
ncbi:PilN domain-containing protein [Pseudoalteromonas sp. YIC-656]|uniref:PilN domain-containing protein n=1 Tax=Pseudoalteromonas pernae TaxID=3118054 RepID=UPI003241C585